MRVAGPGDPHGASRGRESRVAEDAHDVPEDRQRASSLGDVRDGKGEGTPLRNGLLLLGSLLFALAAMELVGRFIPSLSPSPRVFVGERENQTRPNFVQDPFTGWHMRPGVAFQSRQGGRAWSARAGPAGYRIGMSPGDEPGSSVDGVSEGRTIALVGDSQAFGFGVDFEETFGDNLDAALPDHSVVNLAMPGFGIDQMWMAVRHQALPQRPDLVIVSFIDRDFSRSLTAYRAREGFNKPTFVLDGDSIRPQTASDRPAGLLRFLERRSVTWTAVGGAMRRLGFRFPIGRWWHTNARLLEEIHRTCEAEGIPAIFVRLPFGDDARAFGTLRRHMDRLGATYIDLGGPPARADLNLPGDPHLSPLGHRFVASALLAEVRSAIGVAPPALHAPAGTQRRPAGP